MNHRQPPFRRHRRGLAALALATLVLGAAAGSAAADDATPTRPAKPAPLDQGQSGRDGTTSYVTFGVQPANPQGATPRPFYNLTASPGTVQRDNLRVSNFGTRPVTLNVYAADASTASDGGLAIAVRSTRAKEVGSWVRFRSLRDGTLTLPARSRIDLPFDVAVPRRAEPGDHAGAVVVGLLTKSRDRTGALVDVESRVASRLYVRVAGALHPGIAVTDVDGGYEGVLNPVGRGKAGMRFTVRNTGNVRVGVRTDAGLRSLFGSSVTVRTPQPSTEVLPGDAVVVTVPASRVLPLLRYEAHVVATPQPGPQAIALGGPSGAPVSGDTSFWAVPWAGLALIGLLVLAGLVGIVVRRRMQRGGGRHSARRTRTPHPAPTTPAAEAGQVPKTKESILVRLRPAHCRAAAVCSVALALLLPLAPAPASAAGADGTLTFLPAAGKDITPMYFVTSHPCPAEATNVQATMYGKGFPRDGQVVVSNSTSGISHSAPFVLPIQDTMANYAAQLNISLAGPYRIVLSCKVRLGQRSFAAMAGTVTFRTAHDYSAPAPTQAQVDAVVGQAGAQADGQLPPTRLANGAQKSGPSSGTATGGAPGATTKPGNTGGTPTPSDGRSASAELTSPDSGATGDTRENLETDATGAPAPTAPPSLWPLAAGGVGLLVLGAILALRTPHRSGSGAERRTVR